MSLHGQLNNNIREMLIKRFKDIPDVEDENHEAIENENRDLELPNQFKNFYKSILDGDDFSPEKGALCYGEKYPINCLWAYIQKIFN